MKYCALCCIAKDEDPSLKEWLSYHALIGFEHFIIYDNLSEVPIHRFLSGWADMADITVIRNASPLSQELVYTHCLEAFSDRFQWIAFLDLDEFLRLTPQKDGKADIRLFLPEFEAYAGLGVNWRMFTSNGHETMPEGLVITNYTRCMGDDHHIKSIVQPAKVRACAGPHSFYPKPGEHVVNAGHLPIPDELPFTPAVTDRIAVNHYFYKSRQCFEAKIAKGNPCNIIRRMQEFENHLKASAKEDAALVPYAPAVREAVDAPAFAGAARSSCQDYNSAAQAIRSGREGDNFEQALLHLNEAWMINRADNSPDPVIDLDILILRARAAILSGNYRTAERFLERAFLIRAERQTHLEYANLCARTGRMPEAKTALDIVRVYDSLEAGHRSKSGR